MAVLPEHAGCTLRLTPMDDRKRFSITYQGESMSLAELDARIDARVGARLDAFAENLQKQSDEQYQRLVELFTSGFPDGSPVEHRLAHEEMMRLVRSRRRLTEELLLHLTKGGAWALLVFLLVAAWQWLKGQMQGGG